MLSSNLLISLLVTLAHSSSGEDVDENHVVSKQGADIILPCWTNDGIHKKDSVYWVRSGQRHSGHWVQVNGSLSMKNIKVSDTNVYVCRSENDDQIISKTHLYVQGPPPPPTSVVAEGLQGYAIVKWEQKLNPMWEKELGDASTTVNLRYRLRNGGAWTNLPDHLPPSQGVVEVYGLQLNKSYEFQLWSRNRFGSSRKVETTALTAPHYAQAPLMDRQVMSTKEFALTYFFIALLTVLNFAGIAIGCHLRYKMRNKSFSVKPHRENSESIEMIPNVVENPNYSSQVCLLSPEDSSDIKVLLSHAVPINDNNSTFM